VFEKAQRKVQEVEFFVRHLHSDRLAPEHVEFYWSAMLNAAKTVVYALRVEIDSKRQQTNRRREKKESKDAYSLQFDSWHKNLASDDADLFDVLQEVRDVEVHEIDASVAFVPSMEEQRIPRRLSSDPHLLAVQASYMAMGTLSYEETIGVLRYHFQVKIGNTGRRAPKVRALFEKFRTGGQRAVLDACDRYAKLLRSVIAHFVETCQRYRDFLGLLVSYRASSVHHTASSKNG